MSRALSVLVAVLAWGVPAVPRATAELEPAHYPNTYESPFPFIEPRRDGGGSDENHVKEYGPGPSTTSCSASTARSDPGRTPARSPRPW